MENGSIQYLKKYKYLQKLSFEVEENDRRVTIRENGDKGKVYLKKVAFKICSDPFKQEVNSSNY